jgi:hypothetical protein
VCALSDANKRHVMRILDNFGARATALALVSALVFAPVAAAVDLEPATNQAYDHYVALTQQQVSQELAQPGMYLWIDQLPSAPREADVAALKGGGLVIERLETEENGKPITAPSGLIHHWVGTVFIPGATLDQTLAFMQDYDHKVDYFKPDIVISKTLSHSGGDYTVHLRFYTKKVLTTVIDTDQEIHYERVDRTHAWSRSRTTRVQEVTNPGEKDERLEPEGHDRGFVWRMNTFWRFQQKDGGTYVECQAISLSRDIPTGLGWMVGPFVQSVPKESLTFTLETARDALTKKISARN